MLHRSYVPTKTCVGSYTGKVSFLYCTLDGFLSETVGGWEGAFLVHHSFAFCAYRGVFSLNHSFIVGLAHLSSLSFMFGVYFSFF